jgi:hypothetical protein
LPKDIPSLKALAEKGNVDAQYRLALLEKDGREAAKWFRKAAEQGVANAQFNLALMYDRGEGVTQDYAEAAKWFHTTSETNGRSSSLSR